MKIEFVTFANTSYMSPTRIVEEAKSFGVFHRIRTMTEHEIPAFIRAHRSFIENNTRGYGLYIWKPRVILDTLERLADGDILVYCDAGMKLNTKGLPRFHEYIERLQNPDTHLLVFSTNDSYIPQRYVKQDAVMHYFPEFNDTNRFKRYYYAGVMILKKTEKTMALVRDYLALCETERLLTHSVTGTYPEVPGYQGNDGDNALFNLCLAKHSIHADVYPDETNLYDSTGTQDYAATDWSSLDAFPFQYRRLAPRIYQTRREMVEALVPKNGVYAEIGVFKGEFSDFLATTLQPRQLVLIDLFEGMMGSGDQDGNNFEMVNLNFVYTHLLRVTQRYPALQVHKGDSVATMNTYPDNTFDMIYIDADHSYEGTKRDLSVAYAKIKHGGWIMGHDYEMNMKKAHRAYEFGVRRAVDEFCAARNQSIFAKGLDGCVSFAIRIEKA